MSYSDKVSHVLRGVRMLVQDSWQSTLGGLGSRSDRGRVGSVTCCDQPTLTDYELSAAYRNLWLVRRLVEAKPGDALREGFGVEASQCPEFMRLNYATHVEGAIERALMLAQLKGGAGVFVGFQGDSADSILEPAPEGKRDVAFLETFDKFQLTAQERNDDILSPDYDKPEVWCVTGTRRSGMRFHTSRLIKFYGAPLPSSTLQGQAAEDRDWGDSVLQAVWADVQRYGVFWQSVAHLMQLSSVGVLKIAGLIEMLASQNQDVARDRVDLLNESMSITRLMLLDAKHDESYTREAVSFADMPALLQEIQTATAGAFKMPVTKLFGRSPAGMNATGESDTRMWYDEVECYRERSVRPGLAQLLGITDGVTDALDFPSLWQESERERQETRKLAIDANERLWTMGVVGESEIRQSMHEGKPIEELMTGPPPEDAGPEPQASQAPPAPPAQQPGGILRGLFDARDAASARPRRSAEQLIAAVESKLERQGARVDKALQRYVAASERAEKLRTAGSSEAAADDAEGDAAQRFVDTFAAYAEALDAGAIVEETDDIASMSESLIGRPAEVLSSDASAREAFDAALAAEDPALAARWTELMTVQTAIETAQERAFKAVSDMQGEGGYADPAKVKKAVQKALQTGPRGGRFYISASGSKVYRT